VFLTLFPVFTLSANFPLIAITLRNNLILLLPPIVEGRPMLQQILFSLVATVPPICVAFATKDVDLLVNITGSYAGLGIMFVIPAFLVLYSRKKLALVAPDEQNPHRSPFAGVIWIYVILAACVLSVGLMTFNHIYEAVG